MTTRRAAIALGLVGVFVVSALVGGFIARQMRGAPVAPPVAVASPTAPASPMPVASPTASPTAVTSPPTPPASTPSTLPTGTPVPPPTATPTATISTPTPTPVPSPTLDPATAEEFATELAAAINAGDVDYLTERLHPAVIERYGARQCRRFVRTTLAGDEVDWEVLGSSGPAPWPYASDERETVIEDAWAVTVRQPGADPETSERHFTPADGTWRWFTDCGVPG